MIKLRKYQEESVKIGLEVLRDKKGRREILCACTAAGKSIIIAEIVKELKDEKILTVMPSEELLVQNLEKIEKLGIYPSVYSASLGRKETDSNLIYATPKSLSYEVLKDLKIKHLLVDEVDFSTQPGTEFISLIKKLKIKSALGFTATPIYLIQSLDGAISRIMTDVSKSYFTNICGVVQIQTLVSQGYWSDLKHYDVYDKRADETLKLNQSGSEFDEESLGTFFDKFNLAEKVSTFLKRLPKGEDALVFVPSIENSETLQKLIPNSVCIHSKVNKKDRKERVDGFKSGKYSVAITPIALTVGFDKPSLRNIVDCTPTNSIRLYMQKVGRGVRIYEGKEFCRYIDYSGNFRRFGDVRTITIDKIDNYGWGMFSGNKLLTDVVLKSDEIITKEMLINGYKPNTNYVFGEHNKGDAELTFGKFKGKTVKDLYYKQRHYLKWLAESDMNFQDKELERQIKSIFGIEPNVVIENKPTFSHSAPSKTVVQDFASNVNLDNLKDLF